MTLLRLDVNKYIIVQDNCDKMVELVYSEGGTFTVGTRAEIGEAKWYGWKVCRPNQIREYKKAEVMRTATKLKAITRYCKLNRIRGE